MPPTRIYEDQFKCLGEHILAVQKARGIAIQGLGDRNGDRRVAAAFDLTAEQRGGKRPTRKEQLAKVEREGLKTLWIHPDAWPSWEALMSAPGP